MIFYQNNIIQVSTEFLPLVSSNTQSVTGDEGGRPEEKNTNSESTIVNKNNDTNEAK